MIYKRINPHPALHEFVKEFMVVYIRHDKDSGQLVKVLPPSPENGIEFLPLAQATFINQHTGKIFKETKTILFGQPVSQTKFIILLTLQTDKKISYKTTGHLIKY